MRNSALNIVFIVINSIELVLGVIGGGAFLLLGAFLFVFSGLDGGQDYRVVSAFLVFFLITSMMTLIGSLITNIVCLVDRQRSLKNGTEQSKGKWVAAVVLGCSNAVLFLGFLISVIVLIL